MSTAYRGAPSLDPVRINQIFDKILTANNLEIEERSLKSLAQKVNLKLIDCGYLIANHGQQLARLFDWIGNRAQPLLQGALRGPPGSVCSMQAISHLAQVFLEVCQRPEGRSLVLNAGGKEVFHALISCLPPSEVETAQVLEKVMHFLVEGGNTSGFLAHPQSETLNRPEGLASSTFPQMGLDQNQFTQDAHRTMQMDDARSELTSAEQSVAGFSRRDFSVVQRPGAQHSTINDRDRVESSLLGVQVAAADL
jgi:hypothetical protein